MAFKLFPVEIATVTTPEIVMSRNTINTTGLTF